MKEGKGEKKNWKSKEEAKAEGGVEEGRAGARKREEETPLAAPASLCFSPLAGHESTSCRPVPRSFSLLRPVACSLHDQSIQDVSTPFSPARVPPSHPISLMDLRRFLTWTCLVYALKVHF